jgi:DNA-binding NtrC family response regulator
MIMALWQVRNSPAIQRVLQLIDVAPADAHVLIQGQSGTGKELIAGIIV